LLKARPGGPSISEGPARNKKAAGSPPQVKIWCYLTIIALEDVTKSQEKNPGQHKQLEAVGTIGNTVVQILAGWVALLIAPD
jgi:hypothetical protein